MHGPALGELKGSLEKIHGGDSEVPCEVFLYENGRTAEYEFLKAVNIPKGSNVVVLGYTCNAVINPILWLDLEPRYIDIDEKTFSFDMTDLNRKIDSDTRVIILQHTYGIPGPIDEVMKIAGSRNILVLEDCAHALGGTYGGSTSRQDIIGTKGDAAIISFGIEKILGSRVGGALIVNNRAVLPRVSEEYSRIRTVSIKDTFLWLINPVIWRMLRVFPLPDKIAKVLNSVRLLNLGMYPSERVGVKPRRYPRRLSNALAEVALEEMSDIEDNLSHRRRISQVYEIGLSKVSGIKVPSAHRNVAYVRFPIICESSVMRKRLSTALREKGHVAGNWYNPVVYPGSVNLVAMKYKQGECPNSEMIAQKILNLPTGKNISESSAKDIVNIITSNL